MGMVTVGYGKNALPLFSGGLAGSACGGIVQRDNTIIEMIRLSNRSGVTGKERLRLSDRSGVTGKKRSRAYRRWRLYDRSWR
jgi:hypothetical protein